MSGICKVHGRYEGDWCYKCPPLAAPPATCNHRNAHEVGATEVWCSSCKKMVPVAPAQPPQVTMQMLIDAGFDAFGLQLFCESFAGKINPENPTAGLPFTFIFRGLKFTVECHSGEEIDTRHH